MKKSVSKIGLENRVLTPELFKSNFKTMNERVRIYLTRKYPYLVGGNRVTSQDIQDYLQNGLERLMVSFDFSSCQFKGEEITIYGFQKLWFYASQQAVYADNLKARTIRKDSVTKIVVNGIISEMDGKQTISSTIENKLLEINSTNTKTKKTFGIKAIIRNAISQAQSERDKLFYERVLAHLVIETAIRKASKVKNAIPLSEVIDCFTNQFQNADAYFMFRKRMETDIRLKRLKLAA
jgi:hypothetical protein